MVCINREMNPVAIISPRVEIGRAKDRTSDPLFSSPAHYRLCYRGSVMLQTELFELLDSFLIHGVARSLHFHILTILWHWFVEDKQSSIQYFENHVS